MGNSRIGSIRRGLCSKCSYISDDLPQPDGVMACPKRQHASPGCGPITDGAAAGTWRGETTASGLHGVDLAVGLAQMLLPGVPLGRPDTTGWRVPLVKARACKVKELDPVVKRYRVRQDGGPGGVAMPPEHRTGPSYMCEVVLWHVQRGGTHLRGVAPLTDGAAAGTWRGKTVVDVLR